jgi:hypothetical protein
MGFANRDMLAGGDGLGADVFDNDWAHGFFHTSVCNASLRDL